MACSISRQCTTVTCARDVGDAMFRHVAVGACVKARLKLGCLNEHERAEIRTRLLERQRTVAADPAALGE